MNKNNVKKVKVKVEGTGFLGFLQLIFITLKLIGKIEWSWLWVLSPLWIPILFIILVISYTYLLCFTDKKKVDKSNKGKEKE